MVVLVRAPPLPCVDLCIFLVYAGCCRRPGRGINTVLVVFAFRAMVGVAAPGGVQIWGSLSLVCKAAAAFVLKSAEVLMVAFVLQRFVNDGFGTVQMCVAGGMGANVFSCFSVGGTGRNGDTDRLLYIVGCKEDPRLGGSGWSFRRCSVPAPWVRRGVVLCAGAPDVFFVVERSLRFLAPDPVLASLWFSFRSWGLPPSLAGYKYGAYTAGISWRSALLMICWSVLLASATFSCLLACSMKYASWMGSDHGASWHYRH